MRNLVLHGAEVRKCIPYGSKVDMYSFGIMMWEMCYGKEIFTDLIKNHEEIPPPTEVEGYLSRGPKGNGSVAPPAGWTKVMISCCNPSPEERETATESKEFTSEDYWKIRKVRTKVNTKVIVIYCLQRASRTLIGLLNGNICQCH